MAEQILVIRLTETQMKALDAFLGRVNLNAKEVSAFTDVINALTQAQPDSVSEVRQETSEQ